MRGLSELCECHKQSLVAAIICSVLTPAPGNPQEATSLVFDTNNGAGGPDPVTGAPFSTVLVPSDEPTRTGYTFMGWNTASDGSGTSYAAGDTYTLPASDSDTLYAQWLPVEATPPVAEPAEPVSDTPTFTG